MKERILKINVEEGAQINHIKIVIRNLTVSTYRNVVSYVVGNANCYWKKRNFRIKKLEVSSV
jgi:hypothetical protein